MTTRVRTIRRDGRPNTKRIGLVPGSGHGGWAWDLLCPELAAHGYDPIPVEVPSHQPGSTYEDFAEAAARQLPRGGVDQLVLHSGGAHLAPGIVSRLGAGAIGGLVYVGGSIGNAIDGPPLLVDGQIRHWQRNSPEFRRAIIPSPRGDMARFDMSMVRNLLFNDCTPDTARWAMNNIGRPFCRPRREPPMVQHNNGIRKSYILNTDDKVRDPYMAVWIARELGMELLRMGGGHSPAIAQPENLGNVLMSLIEEPETAGPFLPFPRPRQSPESSTPHTNFPTL